MKITHNSFFLLYISILFVSLKWLDPQAKKNIVVALGSFSKSELDPDHVKNVRRIHDPHQSFKGSKIQICTKASTLIEMVKSRVVEPTHFLFCGC